MTRSIAVRCFYIGALSFACGALAFANDGGQFYGLLRGRDITPFGSLRLDMRPAHAIAIERGSYAIAAELGSAYTSRTTELEDLNGTKYQVTLGLRHMRGDYLFTFGVTENLQNVNNTPDIGIQIELAFIPGLIRQSY